MANILERWNSKHKHRAGRGAHSWEGLHQGDSQRPQGTLHISPVSRVEGTWKVTSSQQVPTVPGHARQERGAHTVAPSDPWKAKGGPPGPGGNAAWTRRLHRAKLSGCLRQKQDHKEHETPEIPLQGVSHASREVLTSCTSPGIPAPATATSAHLPPGLPPTAATAQALLSRRSQSSMHCEAGPVSQQILLPRLPCVPSS